MNNLILGIYALLGFVIVGLVIFAGVMINAWRTTRQEEKKEKEKQKVQETISTIRETANEQKESMETGNGAADFNASINQLHQLATKGK